MKAQDALQLTLDDLQTRAIVEETVKSMLIDVELAVSLEKGLDSEEKHQYLQRRAMAYEMALQEARLVKKKDDESCKTLADQLVKELWQLSQELGSLKRWKKENEDTIQERDQLVAKLLLAEEKIDMLQSSSTKANDSSRDSRANDEKNHVQTASQKFAAQKVEQKRELSGDPSTVCDGDNKELAPDLPEPASAEQILRPVVSLVLEDGEAPQLPSLDEPILLHIFAFLDALEIVQLAQVSLGLYSRVDSLFGIGNDIDEPGSPPIPTEIMTQMTAQPTIVKLPPARPTTAPAIAAPPEKKSNLLSLFQTHNKPSRDVDSKAKVVDSKQPLSAAMANSMAEKLSDQEINAIIAMTQKLSKRNDEVALLTQQNVELRGKIDGTEAVKNFLVAKVREIEQILQKNKELESKTAQQVASDQEVIAFLDSRVRELENKERNLTDELKAISDQRTSEQLRSEKKITVLSDMLRYEGERAAENERDWKATRKVLVKEIKSCRGLVMTLQAEKDGLQEQNERLKRALMTTGAINGSPMRGDRK